ncbi:MAG: plasmid pRiA4b ORF-3 family protein [Roseiflexaceae bacterium]
MPPAKPSTNDGIYQLKVTLKGIRPPIWRRILLEPDTRLDRLHHILQDVMGWYDAHLHQFSVGRTLYGVPDSDFDFGPEVEDETQVALGQVAPRAKSKLTYEYDFGDGWEHELLVEKVLPADPAARYPICVAGARACPPEDCGGVWGYADLLETIQNPDHPEHEEMLEWLGGEFDPEAFDLDAINRQLKRFQSKPARATTKTRAAKQR